MISDTVIVTDGNSAQITFSIIEGQPYYLKHVEMSGNTVFSEGEYLELIEYQQGKVFNTFQIRQNLIDMLWLYRDNGYPLIRNQDSVAVDDSVSLFIHVGEGPQLSIGDINIVAPEFITEKTIRREIIVESGDLYNLTNIEESKRRLYETNLFSSVNINLGQVNPENRTIDLEVDVITAKFKGVDMNLGLNQRKRESQAFGGDTELGVGVSGSWFNNNLFSKSRRLRLETEVRSVYPAVVIPQQFKMDLFYIEPWLITYRVPLTINPFYWYEVDPITETSDQAYGLKAIMTYRWFRRIKVQGVAEWNRSSSDRFDLAERSMSLRFIWDRRDSFFYPKEGFKLTAIPRTVGHVLGGENHYNQFQFSFSSYWNPFNELVFAHNIDFAITDRQDDDTEVAKAQILYLGGNTSIRGFPQQGVGPTTIVDGETVAAGGDLRFFSNFELRFPIYGLLGGEVFLDVGNLWSMPKEAVLSDMKAAYGFGLTIDTPIGPARIDHGIPLGEDSSLGGQTHIAIAYAF